MPYTAEPLLRTGRTFSGDVLCPDYPRPSENPGIIRIGHDHRGGDAILFKEIANDRSKAHTLLVVFGSLFPPETEKFFSAHPERKILKRRLHVTLDDAVVFGEARDFNPSAACEITIGYNWIGASTTVPELTAMFLKVERLSPKAGLELMKSAARQPGGRHAQARRYRQGDPGDRAGSGGERVGGKDLGVAECLSAQAWVY